MASCIAALDIMRASPYGGFKVGISLIPQTPMFKVSDVFNNRVWPSSFGRWLSSMQWPFWFGSLLDFPSNNSKEVFYARHLIDVYYSWGNHYKLKWNIFIWKKYKIKYAIFVLLRKHKIMSSYFFQTTLMLFIAFFSLFLFLSFLLLS